MDGSDEARRVRKLLNNGALEPEDLTSNEFRVLNKHYPDLGLWVKYFLEIRQEMIQNGEWTEAHEPPDRPQRFRRYEKGEGIVSRWEP